MFRNGWRGASLGAAGANATSVAMVAMGAGPVGKRTACAPARFFVAADVFAFRTAALRGAAFPAAVLCVTACPTCVRNPAARES